MSLPIELISTDFDGTLHAEFENPPVPHDLQDLIRDLQGQGARWVINTGRDLTGVMEGMARARLTVKPDFLVVVEREIYCHVDSQFVASEAWNLACQIAHAELFGRIQAHLPGLVSWIQEQFTATIYEDDYSPFCLIADSNEIADVLQTHLERWCLERPKLSVVRNDVYARFSHADYNKGTALGEIARQLGIPPARVFAAGDHLNDLPMLSGDFARCLAAPANAVPAVKAAVRRQHGYVSHQPWGHGVARGLEYFLANGAP